MLVLLAASARASEPFDLSCEPFPTPSPGLADVPENALLFGFGIGALTDPNGKSVATTQAPPPWDLDGRYRVPVHPLAATTLYTVNFDLQTATVQASFTTLSTPDTHSPTAPGVSWFAAASDPNQFSRCTTDHTELFGLAPSIDDLTLQGDLRYSLSRVLSDGGLSMVFNELTPLDLPDGGTLLAVQYGLDGLPGDYVVQARDLAGNLSAPSDPQQVEIDPGCTFASSTTGRGLGNLWIAVLALWRWPGRSRKIVG